MTIYPQYTLFGGENPYKNCTQKNMAVISFHLHDRTAKNGMVAIRLRICHRNTNSWHSTGVTIEPDCFNRGSLYDPIQRKAFMYDLKREQLMAIVRKFEESVYDLRKADGASSNLTR